MTRKKFIIMYPANHSDPKLAGKPYIAPAKKMVVMNGQGIFLLYTGEEYYPFIQHLSDVIGNYDVIWKK